MKYAKNIGIVGCTFIGNDQLNVVAIRVTAGTKGGNLNFNIKDCIGESLHGLAQLTSVEGVAVTNCTVTGGKSGLNLNQSTNIVLDNFIFEGSGYGIRAGQSTGSPTADNALVIMNSSIVSNSPCTKDNLEDPETALVLRGDAPSTIIIIDSTISNSNSESFDIANKNGANATDYTFEITNVDWGTDGFYFGGLEGATFRFY